MRTTIGIPDPLFRQVKARAALEGRKLKELLAEYVAQGLERRAARDGAGVRCRSELPVFPRAAATGEPTPALTNAEIAEILDVEDAEHVLRLARR